jgi:putative phage-type endonuclease
MIEQLTKFLPNCFVHSTIRQEDDLEGWLAARQFGIGGSDVGAICGVNNYSTARLVYLKKTGQHQETFSKESLERMYWGHVLEPVVADEFAKRTGKTCVILDATLGSNKDPWALANVDRLILDEDGNPYGILECKTAGEFMNEDWLEGDLPMSYIYQLQWYLYVTGLEYGAFACLVGGNKFYFYETWYNPDMMEPIVAMVREFWNHNVKNLIEPEVSGGQADSEYIKSKYVDVEKGSEIALPDFEESVERIVEDKATIKALEKRVEAAQNLLKEALKNAEIAYTPSRVIKWSPREQTRVDTEVLKSEFPEVYEKVKKTIKFRQMTIK